MTKDELQKARLLCEQATPGPWGVYQDTPFEPVEVNSPSRDIASLDTWEHRPDGRESDAHFIAASRTLVPALLDEVERLRVLLREADKERDHLMTLLTDAHAGLYHLHRREQVEWSVPDLIARIAEELDQ